MLNFEFGENVTILLSGEKHKEVLYGQLESISQRELSYLDNFCDETKFRAQIDFFSMQKEIKEDKEISEAILKHNLKVENIDLFNEVCEKRKELEEMQEKIERAKRQYEETIERLRKMEDLVEQCKKAVW